MRRVYKIALLALACMLLFGCKREAKTPDDYQLALDSIKFDFDLDNIEDDVVLPTETKKFGLEILWQLNVIESDEENYYTNCASLSLKDGVTSIIHKISYDNNYDDRLFGKATLVAHVADGEDVYSKEFTITVYENIPSLNLTITQIKDYCTNQDTWYIESDLKIAWIKELVDDYYNVVLTDGTDYIFVNNAFYNKRYNLKIGDTVKLKGFSGNHNGYPVVSSSEKSQCSIELIEKGSYSYNAQEIAYSDFGKLKANNYSIFLMLVKFDGVLKSTNDGSDYSYYIEGVKNKELIVNVSNYSFNHNNVANDASAKKQLDKIVGTESSVTGFIFFNTDGVWEIIIIPSETK